MIENLTPPGPRSSFGSFSFDKEGRRSNRGKSSSPRHFPVPPVSRSVHLTSLRYFSMPLPHQDIRRCEPGFLPRVARCRHRGELMSKLAQVFTSLRSQAAPGCTSPQSPSPPAPLLYLVTHSAAPDDAA